MSGDLAWFLGALVGFIFYGAWFYFMAKHQSSWWRYLELEARFWRRLKVPDSFFKSAEALLKSRGFTILVGVISALFLFLAISFGLRVVHAGIV